MNQLLGNFVAEVSRLNPALPPLDDTEASTSFAWVIIFVFIVLILLVAFKTSGRTNAD